ncbi:hypothetical protein CEE45_02200 [Candidatus Heimdallarchaeota archaeon B3_Heim]|nr:MAG: hypothetical protein CEE45_02200 [Candidatus Heimdallarchaeota archaeon B3_Heim]
MGSLSIAWKDVTRKRERSFLYIITHSLLVATGINIFLISSVLHLQVEEATQMFNGSIIRIMDSYLTFLTLFSFLASIISASVLASLLAVSRMNDLAVFQSLGGTFKQINRIPLAEIFIITTIGGIVGIIEGSVLGFVLLSFLGFSIIHLSLVELIIFSIGFLFFSAIGTYFAAGFFVNVLIRKKFREILDSQYVVTPTNPNRIWGISTKKRTAFRLGHLLQTRARLVSRIMIIGILVLTLISSFGILGGSIIQNTADSYVDRGYGGRDVIVITPSPSFSYIVKKCYDPYEKLSFSPPTNFADEFIPEEFLSILPPETIFESRLLTIGTIRLLEALREVNDVISSVSSIFNSYIWGVDSSFSNIFSYYSVGGSSSYPNQNYMFMADGYHQFVINQGVMKAIPKMINGVELELQRFEVQRVLLDPFAKGFCCYIHINSLSDLSWHINNSQRNVVFIKNPSSDILDMVKALDLDYFYLSSFAEIYQSFSDQFWMISNIVFLPVILSIGLSLVAFSSLYIIILKKDLYIMRVLGCKAKVMKRIIIWINIFVSLQGIFSGLLLGFSTSYSLLLPQPTLPSFSSWFVLTLSFIMISILVERYITRFISSLS